MMTKSGSAIRGGEMKGLSLLFCAGMLIGMAHAVDRDLDNDGRWDYGRGGTDRDIDNDGRWDYDKGGTDRDLDNDGRWVLAPVAPIGTSTTITVGTTTRVVLTETWTMTAIGTTTLAARTVARITTAVGMTDRAAPWPDHDTPELR